MTNAIIRIRNVDATVPKQISDLLEALGVDHTVTIS